MHKGDRKLRLLLWDECNRNCAGCCNNDFDLGSLPQLKASRQDLFVYSEIMLTGGEPMLHPIAVTDIIYQLRCVVNVPIFMYTATTDSMWNLLMVLGQLDGLTYTIHEKKDVDYVVELTRILEELNWFANKSMRLNVFKGIKVPLSVRKLWNVKRGIEWIKDCPLPEGEDFMRWA